MCGIGGIVNFDGSPVDQELLRQMCGVLRHRGPDAEGFYLNGSTGLAMCRLSIIDLQTGHQPFRNETGTIWAVYNGEIYNFRSLRSTLEKKGHQFITQTDGEVIVHLYEEFREDFVEHLQGMFAIALWDAERHALFLFRDRMGIKPLFYTILGSRLTFGSEMKAILQDSSIPRRINYEAIHYYLNLGYIPAPMTIFQGIYKLPPGYRLTWTPQELRTEPYWDVAFSEDGTPALECDVMARLERHLKEAVATHLESDVPIGTFLSGGIDSSSLVALQAGLGHRPLRTFSIGFEDDRYCELQHARVVARRFQTEHVELVVKPNIVEITPRLVWVFDEPFADSSALPTYYLCQLARADVKVALSGDGGDELFMGYDRYRREKAARLVNNVPSPLRTHLITPIIKYCLKTMPTGTLSGRLQRVLEGTTISSTLDRYLQWTRLLSLELKNNLWEDGFGKNMPPIDETLYFQQYLSEKEFGPHAFSRLDTKVYLPDDLLTKIDRTSMAHSLEVRVPFLDHTVVEFAASIPEHYKLRGLKTKYLLRKYLSPRLPKSIVARKKQGFNIPLARWFRNDLKEYVDEILLDPRAARRGYFNQQAVLQMLREHKEGLSDHSSVIWSLICLELWHQMFIDQSPSVAS